MYVSQIDYTTPNASKDFCDSLVKTGFAVLKNHPIDYTLVKAVFQEWKDFFDSADKLKFTYNNDTQDGLFPINVSETAVGYTTKDLKEFFHYYQWGQCPDKLRKNSSLLFTQLNTLAKELLNWIEINTPTEIQSKLSQPLSQMIENSQQTLMRILHYPPLLGSETAGAVRAAAHEDINLITVLVAASEPGLQVKDIDGVYHDVPVDPGMLAINIGDMLQEATNGYYKSTTHQVVNPIDETARHKARYSIPLFLHARPDVRLSKRYTAGEFLEQRLSELGIKKK